MKIIGVIITGLVLIGCAAPNYATTTSMAPTNGMERGGIAVKWDEFSKTRTITGPMREYGIRTDSLTGNNVLKSVGFSAMKTRDSAPSYGLHVIIGYWARQWLSFESAVDPDGRRLPVTVLQRDVIQCRATRCTYTEHLRIPFDAAMLQELDGRVDVRFRVYHQTGSEDVAYSTSAIRQVVQAMATYQ